MDQTCELDVARFNALRQALFSASNAELERWADDVLGESVAGVGPGDEIALATLLFERCQQQSALDALYDAVARDRTLLRHVATAELRSAPQAVAESLGSYVIGERLGQGNFSSVFAGQRGSERCPFALGARVSAHVRCRAALRTRC